MGVVFIIHRTLKMFLKWMKAKGWVGVMKQNCRLPRAETKSKWNVFLFSCKLFEQLRGVHMCSLTEIRGLSRIPRHFLVYAGYYFSNYKRRISANMPISSNTAFSPHANITEAYYVVSLEPACFARSVQPAIHSLQRNHFIR